jgi:hypothetical protein
LFGLSRAALTMEAYHMSSTARGSGFRSFTIKWIPAGINARI